MMSSNIISSCSLLGKNILIVLYFLGFLILDICFLEGAKIIIAINYCISVIYFVTEYLLLGVGNE